MSQLRLLLALCCIVVVFVCLVTLTLERSSVRWNVARSSQQLTNKSVVLLWTPFFGRADYLPSPQQMACQFQDCMVTSNRSLLDQSRALIFHVPETSLSDLPPRRNANQVWIIFSLESPINTGSLSRYDGLFNWTATHRTDSDVWTPYDHVKALDRPVKSNKDYWTGKTKMVAWFCSNCHTSGGRELFVEEMVKIVQVDIYGSCGNMDCSPKMSFDCYRRAAKDYYFYLSFENSLCKDYVTEKFFHILQFDMVPVVFGQANYSALAPPNSFINALDFESPSALAKYLKEVAKNPVLYNSFFKWRETHALGGYHWVCELCRRLGSRTGDPDTIVEPKIYHDLDRWWKTDAMCTAWTPMGFKPVQ